MSEETATSQASRPQTLDGWLSLLSPKLRQLILEAENQAWPFVYEEWQFEQKDKKESVNTKDLVLSKNATYPEMLEKDVLKECLEFACSEKSYKTGAAVAFLLDRFMYWYGNSEYILKKVEHIRKMAPTIPIAPQVILRKARFLKDGGSLQNADKTLDFILKDERHREQWQYKEQSQYDLVYATCVQIKGVIRHNLGLWLEAADLVLESLVLYYNLPKPDLKGIGSSLGILSDILMNISLPDFKVILTKYSCRYDHPLMEAYAANKQAAWLARFEPFYFARNTRRAGEVLLMFVATLPQGERSDLINQAINDLKVSLKGHTTLTALRSREQLYEFTCSLYHSVTAYSLLGTPKAMLIGNAIEKHCMVIYDYYSASTGLLDLNDVFVTAVHGAFELLELPRLSEHAEKNALVDLPAYDYQYPTLREALPSQNQTVRVASTESTVQPPRTRFGPRARKPDTTRKGEDRIKVSDPSATTLLPPSSRTSGPDIVDPEADTLITDGRHLMGPKCVSEMIPHVIEEDPEAPTKLTDKSSRASVDKVMGTSASDGPDTGERQEAEAQEVDDSQSSSVDTGYEGSLQGSLERGPGDAFLNSNQDDYVASVVPSQKPVTSSPLPPTFLRPDPSNPISSFIDSSVLALSGQGDEPAQDVDDCQEDIYLKMEEVGLDALSVHRARVFKYDPAQRIWTCQNTLVYLDEELEVRRKGAMRDVIKLQYLNQDEPKARYVGKRYRRAELKTELKNYYQDVLCQMTARHYVALFNQALKHNPQGWQIQFVPAVHVQLLSDDHKNIIDVFNVEPYVEGSDFVKVTNNEKYVNKTMNKKLVEVSLAFMHFTYHRSGGNLMVTDLQGWLPQDQKGTIIFTDPAIHSETYKCFETANLGKHGFHHFWCDQHPICNDICLSLRLERPEDK